jgi:hypothetical protein
MTDHLQCDNCSQIWEAHDLDPIQDYGSRVEPGGVVPCGQCPDAACRALCYPASGYVHDLEQQLTALRDVISRLLDWAAAMGGWEAPVWVQARYALTRSHGQERIADLEGAALNDEEALPT